MNASRKVNVLAVWSALLLLVGVFVLATVLEIDYGVRAHGFVANRFSTIPIQHHSVARVESVFVTEGQSVKAGDRLVTLKDPDVLAQAVNAESQLVGLRLQRDALSEELNGNANISFPKSPLGLVPLDSLKRAHSEAVKALRQRLISHLAELSQFERDAQAAETQMSSLTEQLRRLDEQIKIVERQIFVMSPIARDRLVSETSLDELRIRVSDLRRQYEARLAEKASQAATLDQIRSRRSVYTADRENTIRARLSELTTQVVASEQATEASESRLGFLTIVAATDGQVINLQVKTPGVVIEPGRPMMELIQKQRDYFVEARVAVAEIENIRSEMAAEIQFVTLPSKSTPFVDGHLKTVSSNSSINDKTGEEFYIVTVEFDRDVIQSLGFEPFLGTPVEVLLKGGRRNVISYLLDPFRILIRKSMKEA